MERKLKQSFKDNSVLIITEIILHQGKATTKKAPNHSYHACPAHSAVKAKPC